MSLGGDANDKGYTVDCDSDGNCIFFASLSHSEDNILFQGTVIPPGNLVFKLDSSGNLLRFKVPVLIDRFLSLVIQNDTTVHAAGVMESSSITVDGITFTNGGNFYPLYSRIDSDTGQLLAAHAFTVVTGDANNNGMARGIATSLDGSSKFIGGDFVNDMSIGSYTLTHTNPTYPASWVAKIDTNGDGQWRWRSTTGVLLWPWRCRRTKARSLLAALFRDPSLLARCR